MYIRSFKDLIVWQKSMKLVKAVYSATKNLPKEETYGITSQMRRAAVSIPSNIAEGYKRRGLGEYIHFLTISDASAAELETQTLLVKELFPSIDFSSIEALLEEVQKMLITIVQKLENKKNDSTKR